MQNQVVLANIFSPSELLLILLIVFFVFGGKKLPQIAKDVGNGIRIFKKSMDGEMEEEDDKKTLPAPEIKTVKAKPRSEKKVK